MNLYTKIVSSVLFPLQERLRKHDTVAVRRSLEKSQWWDAAQLQTLQLSRLRVLLQHAADEQIDRVRQIPRQASGKYRYVVSHVDPRRTTAVAA